MQESTCLVELKHAKKFGRQYLGNGSVCERNEQRKKTTFRYHRLCKTKTKAQMLIEKESNKCNPSSSYHQPQTLRTNETHSLQKNNK